MAAANEIEAADRITFLDVLVALSESWLWIVVPALAVAAITFGIYEARPTQYRMSLVVAHDVGASTIFRSAEVLRNKLEEQGSGPLPALEGVAEVSDGLARLEVSGGSRNELLASVARIAESLSNLSRPDDSQRATLSAERERIKGEISELTLARDALRRSLADQTAASPVDVEVAAQAMVQLLDSLARREQRLVEIDHRIQGIDAGRVVQSKPIVTEVPAGSLRAGILAGISAALLAIVAVVIRAAIVSAGSDPVAGEKMSRIARAFSFRGRKSK